MTSIFMVHSVLAASETGKVTRDHGRDGNSSSNNHEAQNGTTFSKILQQEVEEMRMDSINCRTLTYGSDRRVHPFEYRTREYHF